MPVWHELTETWRENGDLTVIGIVQEQHPDRAALYAQWQGFEWPILWDPLNLTGAKAVPNLFAIDEHGIVRQTRPRPQSFEQEFLMQAFDDPGGAASAPAVRRALCEGEPSADVRAESLRACAQLLWGADESLDESVDVLTALADEPGAGPAARFRLGVALRRRHDSAQARPGDFQAALEAWSAALAADPNQYIWRRRLQQYGPRLDKPYPFYDWVARATSEVRARGVEPVAVRWPLSGAEIAGGVKSFVVGEPGVEPDPEGRILRDEEGFLSFEGAVTFDTSPPGRGGRAGSRSARVHLEFRPRSQIEAHWNNSVEPARVWVDLPEGWQADRVDLAHVAAEGMPETSDEPRVFDFELRPPEGEREPATLSGYLLFHACEGVDGQCVYRRRDFELEVAPLGS